VTPPVGRAPRGGFPPRGSSSSWRGGGVGKTTQARFWRGGWRTGGFSAVWPGARGHGGGEEIRRVLLHREGWHPGRDRAAPHAGGSGRLRPGSGAPGPRGGGVGHDGGPLRVLHLRLPGGGTGARLEVVRQANPSPPGGCRPTSWWCWTSRPSEGGARQAAPGGEGRRTGSSGEGAPSWSGCGMGYRELPWSGDPGQSWWRGPGSPARSWGHRTAILRPASRKPSTRWVRVEGRPVIRNPDDRPHATPFGMKQRSTAVGPGRSWFSRRSLAGGVVPPAWRGAGTEPLLPVPPVPGGHRPHRRALRGAGRAGVPSTRTPSRG
jgi:hypothetical protein